MSLTTTAMARSTDQARILLEAFLLFGVLLLALSPLVLAVPDRARRPDPGPRLNS